MTTVFEPMRPVPPMTTIFMVHPPLSMLETPLNSDCSLFCGRVHGVISEPALRRVID
jgi:hypothetical protein